MAVSQSDDLTMNTQRAVLLEQGGVPGAAIIGPGNRVMSRAEERELLEREEGIRTGLEAFLLVAEHFLAIREKRLYRFKYDRFEDYCRLRWNMTPRRAQQIVAGADVRQTLALANGLEDAPATQVLPKNEREARPLEGLPKEEQPEAWRRVVESAPKDAEGKPQITAKHVEGEIKKLKAESRKQKGEWPEPNEHGIYHGDERIESIEFTSHLAKASIDLLQIGEGKWIYTTRYQHRCGSCPGSSAGLSADDVSPTRDEALRKAAEDLQRSQQKIASGAGLSTSSRDLAKAAQKIIDWTYRVCPRGAQETKGEPSGIMVSPERLVSGKGDIARAYSGEDFGLVPEIHAKINQPFEYAGGLWTVGSIRYSNHNPSEAEAYRLLSNPDFLPGKKTPGTYEGRLVVWEKKNYILGPKVIFRSSGKVGPLDVDVDSISGPDEDQAALCLGGVAPTLTQRRKDEILSTLEWTSRRFGGMARELEAIDRNHYAHLVDHLSCLKALVARAEVTVEKPKVESRKQKGKPTKRAARGVKDFPGFVVKVSGRKGPLYWSGSAGFVKALSKAKVYATRGKARAARPHDKAVPYAEESRRVCLSAAL